MRLKQSNKLTMYTGMISFLKSYLSIVNLIVKFAATLTRFEAKVAEILSTENVKETATSGKTDVKYSAEEDLIDTVEDAAASIYNYAEEKNKLELKEISNVSGAKLEKLKDNDLINRSQQIYDAALPFVAELVDFGLTSEELAAIPVKIEAFRQSIGGRGASVGVRSGAGTSVEELIKEADALLEKLDKFVDKFRTKNPVFYDGYYAARAIKNYGVRHIDEAKPEGDGNNTESSAGTPAT